MAKKIKISKEEITVEKEMHLNSKNKTNIVLIAILIILGIGLIISLIYYNNKVNDLKNNYEELKKDYNDLEDENEEIHSDLFSVIGDKSTYYINNKLDFFDENIVFQIEGFGNYYYTYDCMMKKVTGNYRYWGYNKEAAIGKGLRAGSC